MKVLIVDVKGQIIGDFLSETETQLESDALRYLNTGVARQDSILIAGDKVWSFVESDGVLKCELNQRLTLKRREQESKFAGGSQANRTASTPSRASVSPQGPWRSPHEKNKAAKSKEGFVRVGRGDNQSSEVRQEPSGPYDSRQIDCPECDFRIGKSAFTCPRCGCTDTPARRAREMVYACLFVFSLISSFFLVAIANQ